MVSNEFLAAQATPLDDALLPVTPTGFDAFLVDWAQAPYRPFQADEFDACIQDRVQAQHLRRARRRAEANREIIVCGDCLKASCWYEDCPCKPEGPNSTTLKSVVELRELALEPESFWSNDLQCGQ